jgi:hypothetical protein
MMVPVGGNRSGQATGRQGRLSASSPTAAPPPVSVPPTPLRGLPSFVRGNAVIVSWVRGGGCQIAYNFQRNS